MICSGLIYNEVCWEVGLIGIEIYVVEIIYCFIFEYNDIGIGVGEMMIEGFYWVL